MDPPSLEKYYQTVNVTSSTFFQNKVFMNRFGAGQQWSALGKPVDRDEWYVLISEGLRNLQANISHQGYDCSYCQCLYVSPVSICTCVCLC
jgi:hypothetical protein